MLGETNRYQVFMVWILVLTALKRQPLKSQRLLRKQTVNLLFVGRRRRMTQYIAYAVCMCRWFKPSRGARKKQVERLAFFYPSQRLGISSPKAYLITHQRVFLRLDEYKAFRFDDIPQQVADDIQGCALIFYELSF